eukprot:505080_1
MNVSKTWSIKVMKIKAAETWLEELQVNDKIDVYDTHLNKDYHDKTWIIGTIAQVTQNGVHILNDGCRTQMNNYFSFNTASNEMDSNQIKIAQLNTFTPIHCYYSVPGLRPCPWYSNGYGEICSICNRNVCMECLALKNNPIQCKFCIEFKESTVIFNSIHLSIHDTYFMDINLIQIICCNSQQCSNAIPEDNGNVHLIDALGDQRTSQNVIYCFVQNCTRFNEGSTLYLHVMILKSERLLNKFKLSFVCKKKKKKKK